MSLQTQTPSSGGLGAFWASISAARRRRIEPQKDPAEIRLMVPQSDAVLTDDQPCVAEKVAIERYRQRPARKRQDFVATEKLARDYIDGLKQGDYAYRFLKDEFDALCDEAELLPVSDKRMGLWLHQSMRLMRYRTGHPTVVMYRIAPRLKRAA